MREFARATTDNSPDWSVDVTDAQSGEIPASARRTFVQFIAVPA